MAFKRKSKSWSIILTIAMLFMLWPGGAVVADPPSGTVSVTTKEALLQTVSEAVYSTISIDADITLDTPLTINRDVTLTSSNGSKLDVGSNTTSKITIPTGNVTFNGDLQVTGDCTSVVAVESGASFTLDGGASVTQESTMGHRQAVYNNGGMVLVAGGFVVGGYHGINNQDGTVNVTDGTVRGTENGIYNADELIITNGIIEGVKCGVCVMGSTGNADISGDAEIKGKTAMQVGSGATADISGGSFTVSGGGLTALNNSGTVALTGGSFTGKVSTGTGGTLSITSGNVTLDSADNGVYYNDSGSSRAFLKPLPGPITDAEVGVETTVSLAGVYAGVAYDIVEAETDEKLGAEKTSATEFTLTPTDEGNYNLVLTASGSGQIFKLTLPVAVTASSLTPLAVPTGLVWDTTTPSKAKWNGVIDASSYRVQLYKGGTKQGSAVSVAASTLEHDFTPEITTAGIYTFKVTAVGDGINFRNSPQSAASPAYSYTAPTVVCEISTTPSVTPYTSLDEALAAVEDGQTITLKKNIDHPGGIIIDGAPTGSKTVTFNLAGYTLNVGSASASLGIKVQNGGKLELFGDSGELNVTAQGNAVEAVGAGSYIEVTKATSTNNIAAFANTGGEIVVRGDAEGATGGVWAQAADSEITVGGNVIATIGTAANALGGIVSVTGDATGVSGGAYASGAASVITVSGDAKATGIGGKAAEAVAGGTVNTQNALSTGANSTGAYAMDSNSKINIAENVQGEYIAAEARDSAEIIVGGNTIANGSGGVGAWVQAGGKIIIDGSITANPDYIKVGSSPKAADAGVPDPTKFGYLKYTDNTSFVWVKDPTAIPPAPPVRIAAGRGTMNDGHTLFLKDDGTVWSWGFNGKSQLGYGPTDNGRLLPEKIQGLSNIVSIETGHHHALALAQNGEVWSWGDNVYSQQGGGTTGGIQTTPAKVSILSNVKAIAAGWAHSLALKDDGTLWAWGYNSEGQVGNNSDNVYEPTPVQVLDNVAAISAGNQHSLVLKNDGTVWAWGNNGTGQLGIAPGPGKKSPQQVLGLSGITRVYASDDNSAALAGNSLYVWGANNQGQLGDGTKNARAGVGSVLLSGVKDISGSGYSLIAQKTDNSIWVWGYNSNGQLGNGTNNNSLIPIQSTQLSALNIQALAVVEGGYHCLAIDSAGDLWAWGWNNMGQLGDGTQIDRNVPVRVQFSGGPPLPTVTGVTVTPSTATVQKGTTKQFSATVEGTNNPSQNVTWSVNSTSGSSISTSGLLTVVAGETAATLTVTATSTVDNTKSGMATVTVTESADPDSVIVGNALTAVENATYGNISQGAAGSEVAIKAAIRAIAVAALNNSGINVAFNGVNYTLAMADNSANKAVLRDMAIAALSNNSVTVTVNTVSYAQPVAGTAANPSGTNGSYTFTVTVGKGALSSTTAQKTVAISATAYTSPGSPSGGSSSSSPSGTLVTSSGTNVSDSGVALSFPAGAVESDVRVQVREAALTSGMSLPADSQLISKVLDIVKDKSGNFAEPVTVTMSFNRSQIDSDKYDIKICYFDEEKGQWVELDNIEVDMASGTVSGQVEHFTKFAVIATPKAVEKEEVPTPEPQPEFKLPADIAGHWAQESIVKLMQAGVTNGYTNGSFQPEKEVSRAEFTVMLVKALKLEPKQETVFKDTASHWAKDSIATASAHGVISGYDQNSFGPDDKITREQAAVIITRAAKLQAGGQVLSFSDAKQVSPWALSGVTAVVGNSYMGGYPDNSFRPQGFTSRAESAVIIARLLKM